jgi:hypothetical protein
MGLIRQDAKRDLRVDFFRGLALWWIYTDHIPGDALANYSLRNFAMCDATEIFVLLAGYGAGLAYGATMNRQGALSAMADVLRRAWTLYVAHIFLFVVYTAQVAYSAAALDRGYYLEETRLDIMANDPYRSLLEALLLRFQPSLLNILPLYVALLVLFAPVLPLLRWPKILFVLSFTLYAVVRATGLNLWSWDEAGWYFDPLAWQLLFVIGAILAYSPPRMPDLRWPVDVTSVLVLVAGLVVIWVIDIHPGIMAMTPLPLIRFVITEDKTGLHPFRLLSILALAWLVIRLVASSDRWLRTPWAAPLVLMGQNSLAVFCSGIFFGFFARVGLEYDDHAGMQVVVNLFGAMSMVAVGALVAWYRGKGRPVRPTAVLPSTPRTGTG